MALSKSTRIMILIGCNAAFFFLELIVGSSVHSLALVADAFHMLNDVISLCVGLWAVKAANSNSSSKMYTYGWQRAEILGGLVNGVFLVALCLSIFLDAIQRFFEPQVVANPMLVLIVGCCGLLFNILGLFLFHNHGHSHGEDDHAHRATDPSNSAEEGIYQAEAPGTDSETRAMADENGNVADVLPQAKVGVWPTSKIQSGSIRESSSEHSKKRSLTYTKSDEDDLTVANSTLTKSTSPLSHRDSNTSGQRRHRRRQNSGGSRSRFTNIDDLNIHPASFRRDIIAASRLDSIEAGSESDREEENFSDHTPHESSPLLKAKDAPSRPNTNGHAHTVEAEDLLHAAHNHAQPKDDSAGGHGHSHSDLNMRGVFLHVMGDALGNIGVIISALIIWLTTWPGRYYADPAISLAITIVILTSAIPLCKAASKILLQAVPVGIDVDNIKDDIEDIPGIISCHHLHVWQLSNVKYIASLHVQLEVDFKGEGSAGYMKIAKAVRHCLNAYGIKSSTIQPEFCLDAEHNHTSGHASDHEGGAGTTSRPKSKGGSNAGSLKNVAPEACLLDCGDECGEEGQCCAPVSLEGPTGGDGHGHDGHAH